MQGSFGHLSGSFSADDEKKLEKDATARDPLIYALIQEEIDKKFEEFARCAIVYF